MDNLTKIKSVGSPAFHQKIIIVIIVFILSTSIFLLLPPLAGDWGTTFYQVSKSPLHPYDIRTFMNFPWITIVLYPFHFISIKMSSALNASCNLIVIGLLVIKRKGNLVSLILTLTSFPFVTLLTNGSIEWIPALGFILQNGWGLVFLLTKPQSGVLAIFAWFSAIKNKILFFLPAILVIVISLFVWRNWIIDLMSNIQHVQKLGLSSWNISQFPWSIPIGLGLMFIIFKYKPLDGELLGTLATLCLVPYFAIHSINIFFALLSASHRRIAIILWFLLWIYLFLIL